MSYKQLYLHPVYRENRDIAKVIYNYVYADIIVHRRTSKEYRDLIESGIFPKYKTFKKFEEDLNKEILDNIPVKLVGFNNARYENNRNLPFFYYNGDICNNLGKSLENGEYEKHKYHAYYRNCAICYGHPYARVWRNWWIKEIRAGAEGDYDNICEDLKDCGELDAREIIKLYEETIYLLNVVD